MTQPANAVQILRYARSLIDQPSKNCTGWFAKNSQGLTTGTNGPDAVAFCAVGALMRAAHDLKTPYSETLSPSLFLKHAARTVVLMVEPTFDFEELSAVVHVNDDLGFDATQRMYNLAIQMAEANV